MARIRIAGGTGFLNVNGACERRLGNTDVEDLFLDQQSLYWLRMEDHQHDSNTGTTATIRFDYSAFNQPFTINPPRVQAL